LPQILAENPMEKEMDEGRKRTLGVIAAIFACRKLSVLDVCLANCYFSSQTACNNVSCLVLL